MTADARPAEPRAPVAIAGMAISSAVYSLLSYAFVGRASYGHLVGFDSTPLSANERWLVPLTIASNTLLFVLPGLLLGCLVLAAGTSRRRASAIAFALVSGVGAGLARARSTRVRRVRPPRE